MIRQALAAQTLAAMLTVAAPASSPLPAVPAIRTGDVDRFYRIYDAAGGRPSAEVLKRDYLDAGSEGLHILAARRNVTGERIAAAIAKQPALYVNARRCAAVMPAARKRLAAALAKLGALYPSARTPDVTVAIGRGKPIGIGSPETGLQIGLEALCGVTYADPDLEDRFVHVLAHEYVHVQQAAAVVDNETPTVLQGSLVEGIAEFVGELISGGVCYAQTATLVRGREAEVERKFVADQDKTDLSDWLYNGTLEKQGDLGYWVGYRIAKAYYASAKDKRAAVRDMLEMTDAKAFLAKSGWRPGMTL